MNGSMETVLECVIPYIHDRDDRNSISLVSRKFYELDVLTRKHLTVHLFYAPIPSRLSERFPFIESLTLKGCPNDFNFPLIWSIDIAPWIEEIAFKFKRLKALQIRGLYVCDEDLELLARARCRDLRSLKIYQCQGVSADGLMHVPKYCNDLRTLCLEGTFINGADENDGAWLHELALHNKVIESLHFDCDSIDVKDLTLIAKQCSNSLVSLKINPCYLSDLEDAFGHAIKLEKFHRSVFDEYADYSSFTFPRNIRGLCIEDLPETAFPFLLPYVNQLRELHLPCIDLERNCQCFLIERCPNLEVLLTYDVCGDAGFQIISQYCKKLRKLNHLGQATHMGLIALARGCPNLENLDVTLLDISNEAMECVGTYLKNLRKFRMNLVDKSCITDLPLDNGIRAMLIGCRKLERLHVSLCHGGLTDVGLGYIGKYGHNLTCLSLEYTGESDAGLVELSKGCPKLRKLRIMECPFSEQTVENFLFNIHTLRYINFFFGNRGLALTRPAVPADAEVLPELKPYVTLAKKLRRLAVQLVADGSGVGSVKITYTSLRETGDLDTPLVDALVAKGIRVNEERVLLDRASEKPLEIIKVQIANVESRLAVAICESGEIKVEGRVKDGVPHLTKVGALDVDVSLEGNIILCRQADDPNIIRSVSSILDDDNVIINSMSFGRITRRKQAVMVIGVDDKPSKYALKKIDKIPDIEEFVYLALL